MKILTQTQCPDGVPREQGPNYLFNCQAFDTLDYKDFGRDVATLGPIPVTADHIGGNSCTKHLSTIQSLGTFTAGSLL